VVAEYLAGADAAGAVDREAFLARHPEFAVELRELFEQQDRFQSVVRPFGDHRRLARAVGVWEEGAEDESARADVETQQDGTPPGGALDIPTTVTEVELDATRGDPAELPSGTQCRPFGDYELQQVLGRGGMGVVYRARQVSLGRLVALKMIRAGLWAEPEEVQRFRNEAQAIADLDHPGIVTIHEVGQLQQRHYFTMKLVEGASLAKMLAEFPAEPANAARLVADVAAAVHHAHLRGILHRDLKPANILVDEEGHPHITDLGLAKRVASDSELTQSGAVLGTPAYMAPEQASGHRGSVTTASDVYGLGAVLYALLTGRAPFGGDSVIDTIDAVRTQAPKPPSRINATVPRDLEIICLKCLEKEPSRRYSSARDLADDLRRWLAGEPIAARPVGGLTRALMWCRRRPTLAGTAAALVLALIGGFAGTIWKWRDAEHQKTKLAHANLDIGQERSAAIAAGSEAERRRKEAEQEAAKAKAVVSFLVDDILEQAAPKKHPRSRGVTIEDALDLAGPAIGERFARQPDIEIFVRMMIGRTFRELGKLDKAEPHLRRALELGRHTFGEDDLQTLQAADDLATLLQHQGKLAEAEPLLRLFLEGNRRATGADSNETLVAMNNFATVLHDRGALTEAESLHRQVFEIRNAKDGPEHPATLMAMANLGGLLLDRGKLAEAEPVLHTVLEIRTRVLGPAHPDSLMSLNMLGEVLRRRGKLVEAEPIFRALLEAGVRVNGADHPGTLVAMNNLALVLRSRGSLDQAEAMIRTCLAARRRILGSEHPDTLWAISILASILQDRGKLIEAEPLFRETYDVSRRTQGDEHPHTPIHANNLADVLRRMSRLHEAERVFRCSLATSEKASGPNHPDTLLTMNNLAGVLLDCGDASAAEPLSRGAMEGDRRVLGTKHPQTIGATVTLAAALLDLTRIAEAESLAREAVTIQAEVAPRAQWSAAFGRSVLGACLAYQRRDADAEPLLIAGYEGICAIKSAPRHHARKALERIIAFYEARGRVSQADCWRAKRLDTEFPADPFAS
jgi:tetratricopeptide (TPR) repeat protein